MCLTVHFKGTSGMVMPRPTQVIHTLSLSHGQTLLLSVANYDHYFQTITIQMIACHNPMKNIWGFCNDLSTPKPGHATGRSGRDGTRQGGGAGRVGAGRDTGGFVRRGDIGPSCPPDNRRHMSWKTFQKHEQEKPVEYTTQTYHGRVGSGRRRTGQRGWAEPGRMGRRRVGSPRGLLSLASSVVRLANIVVVYADGVELVAVQDEGFACALCLNSEEVRNRSDGSRFAGAGFSGSGRGSSSSVS